jgi:AAA+ ATPase superfamily predicted ATPase
MAGQIFLIGGKAVHPYFIGRDKLIETMKQDILSSAQSQLIFGPRRIGKTSLLKNLENCVQNELIFGNVDCRVITSIADFFRVITISLINACEKKHSSKNLNKRFSKIFYEDVRTAINSISGIGGCIEYIGHVYLQFCEEEISEEELFSSTFEFIITLSDEMEESIVLAFDEFQELKHFHRDFIDHIMAHKAKLTCIFSCSSLLKDNSLLIQDQITQIHLEPVEKEDVDKYIIDRLKTQNIKISTRTLDKVYNYTAGLPFYFQKLGSIIFYHSILEKKASIDIIDVDIAFSSMLNELDSEFEESFSTKFSSQQKEILKYLSQNKALRLSEIATMMQTPASSLTTSMKFLSNTMTVHRSEKGLYGIMDNVFRLWIKRNILEDCY